MASKAFDPRTRANTIYDPLIDALSTEAAVPGTAGPDILVGTAFIDLIDAGSGDDILRGLAGADFLIGRAGIDTADYSTSPLAVKVNLATNTATGGDAQGDKFSGIENLTGSIYFDILGGDANPNRLEGLGGIDTADYSASNAAVVINLATGYAAGGHAQGDTLITIESLIGSIYDDILRGDALYNTLAGLAGADILDGSERDDTADYSASPGRVVINLTTGYAAGGHAQGDTLISIEHLIGTAHPNDILTGTSLDNLLIGLAGADTLDGQDGSDTVDYSASPGRVVVRLATSYAAGGHAQGDTLIGIENVIGTAFSNDIFGASAAPNVFNGGPGLDTVDYSSSSAGVVIGLGLIRGGYAEGDRLISIENVIGSAHDDDIRCGAEGILAGLAGADILRGTSGPYDFYREARETADYSASDGRIVVNLRTGYAAGGHAQGDTLHDIECLVGTRFDNDILTGNAEANVLAGLGGADTLIGGDDQGIYDTADYSASDAGVVVNINTGRGTGGHAQGDTLIGIENLTGSMYDDVLICGPSNSYLAGLAGADTLDGTAGLATADYSASNVGVTVNLGTGVATGGHAQGDTFISIEHLMGSEFDDVLGLRGDIVGPPAESNHIDGRGGIDTVDYSAAPIRAIVVLDGNLPGAPRNNDRAAALDLLRNIENITGTAFNDSLFGDNGDNVLTGLAGPDTLSGYGGNDTANYAASDGRIVVNLQTHYAAGGHAQGDILNDIENIVGTRFANDILTGSWYTNNVLTGGNGADIFIFEGQFGADTITDFQDDVDALIVRGAGAIVAQFHLASGVQYIFANGSTLFLQGATIAQSLDDVLIS